MLMITPPVFCSMNWRAAALEAKKGPVRLIPTTAPHPLGDRVEGGGRMTPAVIGDQHVKPPKMPHRSGDRLLARGRVAHVALRHLAFAAGLADLVTHWLQMAELTARDQ